MRKKFLKDNLNGTESLRDLDIDGRIILKQIFLKRGYENVD
jgi:hypothetical protein